MSQLAFDVVLWALLWSTALSPFLFRLFLRRQAEKYTGETVEADSGGKVVDVGEVAVGGMDEDSSDMAVVPEDSEPEASAPAEESGKSGAKRMCCLFLRGDHAASQ